MKNMKKLVSLLLAVCLMASLAIGASAAEPTTVDVSGGTGTSNVSLSSTSDGTLDGDIAAGKKLVGWYALEVPQDWHSIDLDVKSSWLSDSSARFVFKK